MTGSGIDDPAVRGGTRRMLAQRNRLIESGEAMAGWKLAFGAPRWLERFGLDGPVVGYLPASNVREPGATVSCEGWTMAVAEPEIAVYLGRDVEDADQVGEAIAGLGPAIELADVDRPPDDLAEILEGNIFHRAVVLGPPDASRADLTGTLGRVSQNGSEISVPADLESLTGNLVTILGHTARLLETAGERLRAGEVVILGSIVPPIAVEPGDRVEFELTPLPPISVTV
jgi:2-keto-4-pentenoate hydratase